MFKQISISRNFKYNKPKLQLILELCLKDYPYCSLFCCEMKQNLERNSNAMIKLVIRIEYVKLFYNFCAWTTV